MNTINLQDNPEKTLKFLKEHKELLSKDVAISPIVTSSDYVDEMIKDFVEFVGDETFNIEVNESNEDYRFFDPFQQIYRGYINYDGWSYWTKE